MEQCLFLCCWLSFCHFPSYPQANWALLVLMPGWVGWCRFWNLVGCPSELSCEAGSFSHHRKIHRFLQPEVLRLFIPKLEPWIVQSVLLPSCSSWFICTQIWDHLVHQLPLCHFSQLPISAPPTSLNECFLYNSLVVRLQHSLIFWQFLLYFVFNCFVVLLLVVPGGKVYLPMPPIWSEILVFLFLLSDFSFWIVIDVSGHGLFNVSFSVC